MIDRAVAGDRLGWLPPLAVPGPDEPTDQDGAASRYGR